ncbi:hypothetical protein OF83DRAFT_1175635 [Amylostereum chailletii]|nr:hypothetical protein OF83DRAFT_1175635 [Amylostereum chailletii]
MSNSVCIARATLLPHAHLNADFSRASFHPAWVKVALSGTGLADDTPVTVSINVPRGLEDSVSATMEVVGDASSMSTRSSSPPSSVPDLFPASFEFSMFDPINETQWKTLLSSLEQGLVSGSLRASTLCSHGLELFWMAFMGAHPNFPNGDWAGPGQAQIPRDLSKIEFIRVVHFTREYGPVPVLSFSATCRNCGTHYYPTYYVHGHASNRKRTYYPGLPSTIHVTKHIFVETSLCMRFTNSMVCAWVSASNNGRIYDLEHGEARVRFPAAWSVSPSMTVTIVWDAFFLLALIRDHKERGNQLRLTNVGDQSKRLEEALNAWNILMAGQGQECWNHACDRCCAIEVKGELDEPSTSHSTLAFGFCLTFPY